MDDRVIWQMIEFKHKGDFSKTLKFFNKMLKKDYLNILDRYGQIGVERLREYTPKDTGLTANSWSYVIEKTDKGTTITWVNSNVNKHVNIALILQYGHATRHGGWVEGVDYINPALKPVFDDMAKEAWREITE